MARRLVIISPCRSEEEFIEKTLKSVTSQTRPPELWLIVDPGSNNRTKEMITRYAEEFSYIEIITVERSVEADIAPVAVAAFNTGLKRLGGDPYDIIAKLDCNLEFGPNTFSTILEHFDDKRVGMAGGTIYIKDNGRRVAERSAGFHVPGQAKFYRRSCFKHIGGLQPVNGWDIIDETDARRHGWITLSDPDIKIIHHSPENLEIGALSTAAFRGRESYGAGSHPLYAIFRGLSKMAEKPWVVGGFAFMWGFFSSYFQKNIRRNNNPRSIRYIRQEQLYRLFHNDRLPARTYER